MAQESTLARYKVLHEVGRGTIGTVYAARDHVAGAVIALKTLDSALLKQSDPDFARRFLRHARSARRLSHRNIVKIHEVGEAGDTLYVAMEMLEGESLRKILDDGPLPIGRAIQIARDIACGLAYAHLEGGAHGDLKPSNIIVLPSGVVKITDFGIGQLGHAALLAEARAGCLSYLAPEQVRGDPADHRCDIFSLGVLFYEMLTHRAPFEGDSPKKIIENILRAKPPLPSELNQHVPRVIDRIVYSMLARQPVVRMPGVPILLSELQRLEEGLGLPSNVSAGSPEPTASVAPAEPEASVRTPEPERVPDREPAQEPPHFARYGEASDAGDSRLRADSSDVRITDREVFDYQAIAMMERESRRERASGKRPAKFTTLALALTALAVGVAGFMYYSPSLSQLGTTASLMQETLATVPGAFRPTAPPPLTEAPQKPQTAPAAPQPSLPRVVDDGQAPQEALATLSAPSPTPPRPLAPEPDPLAQTETPIAPVYGEPVERGIAASPTQGLPAPDPIPPMPLAAEAAPLERSEGLAARAAEQPGSAGAAPAKELPRAMPPKAKVAEEQSRGTARLILAVSPRGEVYINGKHYGTTPPITALDLEPGVHRVEVRSGSLKPYLTYMTVQPGDVRRVRHQFNQPGR